MTAHAPLPVSQARGSRTLLVRADADPASGLGHAMRCLAITQAWTAAHGRVVWLIKSSFSGLLGRLAAERIELISHDEAPGTREDALHTIETARTVDPAWVVLDGYGFSGLYQQLLKDAGLRALLFDDFGAGAPYSTDLVVNPSTAAPLRAYDARAPHTRFLVGPSYVPLRREFLLRRPGERSAAARADHLLVTFGGSDPINLTERVVAALLPLCERGARIRAVVGSGSSQGDALQALGGGAVSVLRDVRDMPKLLSWPDLAISAAGSTAWELAFCGVPSMLAVVAENQRHVASELERLGAARSLGRTEGLTPELLRSAVESLVAEPSARVAMAQAGRRAVDGLGMERLLTEMLTGPLRLRRVVEEDSRQLWFWANDPDTRAASFSSSEILWDDHVRWLGARLRSPDSFLYIASDAAGTPAGIARFEREGTEAVISVALDRRLRGQGLGQELIAMASRVVLGAGLALTIRALIKMENRASLTAFRRAGFVDHKTTTVGSLPAFELRFDGVEARG